MTRKVLVVLVAAVLFCGKAFPQVGKYFWDYPDVATAGDSDVLLIDQAGVNTLKNVTVGEVRKIPAAKITDSTALGRNFLQLNNGSGAVRYAQINADGSITLLDSAAFLTAVGGLAPSGNGSALTGLIFGQLAGTATDAQIPATIARDAEVAAGYQPLDADLTSLAATAGTNTLYYRSGPDTWSAVTIGANLTFAAGTLSATGGGGGGGGDLFAANNLSELTNKATARSNLQLVIGTDVLAPSGNGSALTGLSFVQLGGTATDVQIPATIARDAEVAAGYQPLDSDLTAIAAFTTTAFGRGLLDEADAAAARVTLGLVIGTDVLAPSGNGSALTGFTDAQIPATIARDAEVAAGYQPLDSDLTSIAALTTTAFGRGLLDEADATAARVTLGLVIGTDVLAPSGNGAALTGLSFVQLGGTATDAQIPATIARDAEVVAGYQPLDADLTSLAATTGTNTLYYRSASGTWSPVTIGSNLTFASGTLSATGGGGGGGDLFAANNLSELTNKATARSNLQLVIGTDVLAPSGNGAALTGLSFSQLGGTATDAQIPATIARDAEVAAGYQPLDSDLTAIAALTTTAFGRGLLDDADATAARVTLGLVIGTDVLAPSGNGSALTGFTDAQIPATVARDAEVAAGYQPLDSDLTSIAALTTTAFGRGLLDDANATAARVTLGLVIGTDVLAPSGNGSALTGLIFGQLAGTTTDAQIPATIARDAEVAAGYQPLNANLTTFAGISPSANVASFLGAANYAAMRTQLTLVPGTDIQAFDADLSSLASASGTNTIYYRSAANTWSPVTIGTNLTFVAGTLDLGALTFANIGSTISSTQIPASLDFTGKTFTSGTSIQSRFIGTGGAVGAISNGSVGVSIQNNAGFSFLEILNNGGAGNGAVIGMSGNSLQLNNEQLGSIDFYTSTSGDPVRRVSIANSGELSALANLTVSNGTVGSGMIDIFEDADFGTMKVRLQAPSSMAADTLYTLPATIVGGGVLTTTAGGVMSWITPSVGGDMLAANNLSELTNKATARTNLQLTTPTGWTTTDKLVTVGPPSSGSSPMRLDAGSGVQVFTQPGGSASDISLTFVPKGNAGVVQFVNSSNSTGFGIIGTTYPGGGGIPAGEGIVFILNNVYYPSTAQGLTLLTATSNGVQLPTGAAPAPSTFGQIAGDNNFYTSGHGALLVHDGTSMTALIGALATDTPANGEIPVFKIVGADRYVEWEPNTAVASGSNNWIQYKTAGGFGAEAGFEYDPATNTFLAPTIQTTNLNASTFKVLDSVDQSHGLLFSVPTNLTADKSFVYTGAFNFNLILDSDSTLRVSGNTIVFSDNVRQTFNPGTTTAGINVGSYAGDPSAPSNGDLWYDSNGNLLRARINGANVSLGAGGGATAWSSIGSSAGNATISLTGFTTAWTSTLDSAGAFIWDITNTDADSAAATGFIQLKHNDGADSDVVYMKFVGDADGTPTNDYVMSQTSFAIGAGITMTIGGAPVMTTRTGVRRTVDINAGSMIPRTTNGAAPVTVELTTNKIMYDGFAFDSTTEEYVGFWWTPPTAYNGGTITIKPRWTAAGGSGNVKWDFKARAYANDDALDAALGTEQTSGTHTLTAVSDMNISPTTPALTAAGTPAANRPEYFEVARDTATDTLSADAVLLGVTVEYTESTTEPSAQ